MSDVDLCVVCLAVVSVGDCVAQLRGASMITKCCRCLYDTTADW